MTIKWLVFDSNSESLKDAPKQNNSKEQKKEV